jgi:hypothetical protein
MITFNIFTLEEEAHCVNIRVDELGNVMVVLEEDQEPCPVACYELKPNIQEFADMIQRIAQMHEQCKYLNDQE